MSGDPRRWVTFCLGDQKHKVQLPVGQETWKTTYSFFVYDIKEDVVRSDWRERGGEGGEGG